MGFARINVLASQKRKYARLQTGNSWDFQRPTRTHFATIGTAHTTKNDGGIADTAGVGIPLH